MDRGSDELHPEHAIDAVYVFHAFDIVDTRTGRTIQREKPYSSWKQVEDRDTIESEPATKSTSEASGAVKASSCSSKSPRSDPQVTIATTKDK